MVGITLTLGDYECVKAALPPGPLSDLVTKAGEEGRIPGNLAYDVDFGCDRATAEALHAAVNLRCPSAAQEIRRNILEADQTGQ